MIIKARCSSGTLLSKRLFRKPLVIICVLAGLLSIWLAIPTLAMSHPSYATDLTFIVVADPQFSDTSDRTIEWADRVAGVINNITNYRWPSGTPLLGGAGNFIDSPEFVVLVGDLTQNRSFPGGFCAGIYYLQTDQFRLFRRYFEHDGTYASRILFPTYVGLGNHDLDDFWSGIPNDCGREKIWSYVEDRNDVLGPVPSLGYDYDSQSYFWYTSGRSWLYQLHRHAGDTDFSLPSSLPFLTLMTDYIETLQPQVPSILFQHYGWGNLTANEQTEISNAVSGHHIPSIIHGHTHLGYTQNAAGTTFISVPRMIGWYQSPAGSGNWIADFGYFAVVHITDTYMDVVIAEVDGSGTLRFPQEPFDSSIPQEDNPKKGTFWWTRFFNSAPTAINLSSSSVAENQPVNTLVGTLTTTDTLLWLDDTDTHSYSLVSGIGSSDNASFSNVGNELHTMEVFNYETKSNYSIRVRSTDNHGSYYERSFTISIVNVNETPTNITLSSSSIAENQPTGTIVGSLTTSDPDVGDSHSYNLVDLPGTCAGPDNASFQIGGVSGNQLQSASIFDYEAKNNYTICLRATDNGGLTLEKQFIISIANVNDIPTTSGISNVTVDEDAADTSVDLWPSFADAESTDDQLTYLVTGNNNTTLFTSVTVVGTPNRYLVLDYAPNANGTATITVRATDVGSLWVETTFLVTVNPVNDTPITSGIANVTVDEDAPDTSIDLWPAFTDVENTDGQLTYTVTSNTNVALFTQVNITGTPNRYLMLDYAPNQNGTADITVRATDVGGLWVETTFRITVNPVNDTPTTSGIATVTVDEDAPDTSIDLWPAFSDLEDADDKMNYSVLSNTNPVLFNAVSITGVPNRFLVLDYAQNQNGVADITLRVTDTGGLWVETTFGVVVNPVNDAPVANNDNFNTTAGTLMVVSAPGLLGNDTDVESDPLTALKDSDPLSGTLVFNADGSFTYKANPYYFGTVTFTYHANDGVLDSNIATVSIAVGHAGKVICSSGGVVKGESWRLTIPSGALNGCAYFTIMEENPSAGPSNPAGTLPMGHRVDIRARRENGVYLTNFSLPLEVCYEYSQEDLIEASNNLAYFSIWTARLGSSQWQWLSTIPYLSDGRVCAQVSHLSHFDLFLPIAALPSTGFAPDTVTPISEKPSDFIFTDLGNLWLEIPRLRVQVPIVGVPFRGNEWDVTWLWNQAGYLQGTAFPTWNGNSVVTSHVYLPNGLPGPFVDLSTLSYNDLLIIHAWGQDYLYEVQSVSWVAPEETYWLTKHEEYPWLTLITCKGFEQDHNAYKYRVVVRAVQVKIRIP